MSERGGLSPGCHTDYSDIASFKSIAAACPECSRTCRQKQRRSRCYYLYEQATCGRLYVSSVHLSTFIHVANLIGHSSALRPTPRRQPSVSPISLSYHLPLPLHEGGHASTEQTSRHWCSGASSPYIPFTTYVVAIAEVDTNVDTVMRLRNILLCVLQRILHHTAL